MGPKYGRTEPASQQDSEQRPLCPWSLGLERVRPLLSPKMCRNQMSPTFRKSPTLSSPLSLTVPCLGKRLFLWLPRVLPSCHQECPRSHLSFPIAPTGSSKVSSRLPRGATFSPPRRMGWRKTKSCPGGPPSLLFRWKARQEHLHTSGDRWRGVVRRCGVQ